MKIKWLSTKWPVLISSHVWTFFCCFHLLLHWCCVGGLWNAGSRSRFLIHQHMGVGVQSSLSPLSSPSLSPFLPSPLSPLSLLPLSSLLNLTCAKEHWPDNGNAKMPAMNIVIKFPKAQTDPIWFYQGTFSAHSRFIASMCNIVGVGVMARMFQMIWQSQWDLDNMRVIPAQHRESTDRLSCKGSLAGTCWDYSR